MVQEQGRLKARIEEEQENLKNNFEEIESRVKDALDWRIWYKNNTALALGGAVAGGLLLAILLPKSSSIESEFIDADEDPMEPVRVRSDSTSRFGKVLDNTVAAVLGVATDKLQDFMSQAIPGFSKHYTDAQRGRMG
jgi:hypothetical protein